MQIVAFLCGGKSSPPSCLQFLSHGSKLTCVDLSSLSNSASFLISIWLVIYIWYFEVTNYGWVLTNFRKWLPEKEFDPPKGLILYSEPFGQHLISETVLLCVFWGAFVSIFFMRMHSSYKISWTLHFGVLRLQCLVSWITILMEFIHGINVIISCIFHVNFLLSRDSAPCVSYLLRKRALYDDMSR